MVDLTNIKGDNVEAQRRYFEQLVCHLAKLERTDGIFQRIEGTGGDGGVEALRTLPSGRKTGYQAKYYPSRDQIDWSKLDKSVETALNQHPELERYVIALPFDFTGRRATRGGATEGIWGKWDKQVAKWESLAVTRGMTVKFEPWTAFEIEVALLRPTAQHLLRFFFDKLVFTREWMQRHLNRTTSDLHARYSPGEHVNTESLKAFDVIYRRENVSQDLRTIFNIARNSDPRAAAALVRHTSVPEADIIEAEDTIREFLALGEALDWIMVREWPICRWLSSWYSLTRQLLHINDAIRHQIAAEKRDDRDLLDRQLSETTKVYELIGPEVFGGQWAKLLPIDGSRAVIFVGRAGAGKSHALARGAECAWNMGAPVVHVLGQDISDDDPRTSILKRLEIPDWSFHEALTALNLAAEAAGTRAMLVIDALNEGRGTDIWKKHLASFVHEVNEHDRVVLVVSCRKEYLDYVVPPEVILDLHPYPREDAEHPGDCALRGKLVRVSINGFRTTKEREAALQKFMDDKGIVRPTVPVLDSEFFNPLFMSSVCRSMAKAGMRVFPRGVFDGARKTFEFVLETKTKALGTKHDGTTRIHDALVNSLIHLTGIMVARREDHVSLSEAVEVVDSEFSALPISDRTWLDVLEGADILRRDVERSPQEIGPWARPNEVVRFSFQRLQDNLIAQSLICHCHDIESAFEPDAPFEFLVKRYIRKNGVTVLKPNPNWIGVIGALWAAIAERYGKELWDLRSFFGDPDVQYYPHEWRPVFHSSIRERSGVAFTQRTMDLLDRLWEDEQEKRIAIILSTSCVPNHAWNVDLLATRLFSLQLADRDSVWSRWFTRERSELVDQAEEITNWALNIDASTTDEDVSRLAGTTLTWLLTVTNRRIRDRATKGLVNLMVGMPTLFPYLMHCFRAIDDPYVLDRLLAAGYGAICLDPMDERIEMAARSVAEAIFGRDEPPVHLSVRDWARSILECAAERDLVPPDFDIGRTRSPFGSAPAVFNVTKDELAKIAATAGDDTIARSCQHNDFFDYVIKSEIVDFSETPLSELPPLTRDERAASFEAVIRELGGNQEDRLDELLRVVESVRKEEMPLIAISDDPFRISVTTPRRKKTTEQVIMEAERVFIDSLPESLRTSYTENLAPRIHRKSEPPARRNPEPVGTWIGRRAYDFGWTKERFPQEPHSSGRRRPSIERIGKKYQWIALEELMARLADNFWIRAGFGKGTRAYESRHEIWRRGRIDPTILPHRQKSLPSTLVFSGPPSLSINEVEDGELATWPFSIDHFDDPEPWLTGQLEDRRCLVADWAETVSEEPKVRNPVHPFRRQVQAFVSMVAHKVCDREHLVTGFLGDHNRGLDGWSLEAKLEGYLAHEFRLMSSHEIPFWRAMDYHNVDIASPIMVGYLGDDTDRSISGNIEYIVPHPRIREALRLAVPDPRDTGLWMMPHGQIFLRKLECRGSPLLLDKEHFDAWCRSEGLDYTWFYIGERTAWTGKASAKWCRTLGAAWFEDGKIRFKNVQLGE